MAPLSRHGPATQGRIGCPSQCPAAAPADGSAIPRTSTIDEAYLCHCRMCQRATGSVSIAFKNVKQANVRWEHEPDWYDSSPIAQRPYCRECGTSLGFKFKDGSENMDLTVASFDDPSRVHAQASFRRREHAPRLAQHRGPARKCAPTNIRS